MEATHTPYKFYIKKLADGRIKTIAVSTYAGRTVRGSAICDSSDTYNKETGQKIAAARCGAKVAQKRLKRATQKQQEAKTALRQAKKYYDKMTDYYCSAYLAVHAALTTVLKAIKEVSDGAQVDEENY